MVSTGHFRRMHGKPRILMLGIASDAQ